MNNNNKESSSPALDLSADDMRQLGYRVIDAMVAHRHGLRNKAVHKQKPRAELDDLIGQPVPQGSSNPNAVLDLVESEILSTMAHPDHPGFFGYIPSPGNFISSLGDALASGFNVFAGHWIAGSAAATVEATTLKWLCELMGFPPQAAGIFLSGGSMANLSAIHTARAQRLAEGQGHDPALVVYATSQTHSSVSKAIRILGFDQDQLRQVPMNSALEMDCDGLAKAVAADRSAGLKPFLVIATAGTTNTGAIDPLDRIADLCKAQDLWLHVDGAYGAAARLVDTSRKLLDGIERADSLTLDPHKWWFQPFEIGCLLVRDGTLLRQAFSVEAEYLRESYAAAHGNAPRQEAGLDGALNFYEYGPQLTRGFRALKFWMFFKVYGVEKITAMIAQGIRAAETAQQLIDAHPDLEIVTPASIGILTFRPAKPTLQPSAEIQRAVAALLADGFTLITTTEIRGNTVLRLCPIHPDLTAEELKQSLNRLTTLLNRL